MLNNLPSYYLSIFKIPNSVAKNLISLQSRFFWGGDSENRKLSTVCWDDISSPKALGGLGLGSIKMRNLGLLMKWRFRYSNGDSELWKKVCSSVHDIPEKVLSLSDLSKFSHGPLKEIYTASQSCPWFANMIENAVHLRLGSGTKIKFWHDPWIPPTPLKDLYPRLYTINTQKHFTISDMGVWDGEIWAWNLSWRRHLFQWEETLKNNLLSALANSKPSFTMQDSLSWYPDHPNEFSVLSFTYQSSTYLFNRKLSQEIVSFIWQKISPLEQNY